MSHEWGWGSYTEFFLPRTLKYCSFSGHVGGERNTVSRIWMAIVEGRAGLSADQGGMDHQNSSTQTWGNRHSGAMRLVFCLGMKQNISGPMGMVLVKYGWLY